MTDSSCGCTNEYQPWSNGKSTQLYVRQRTWLQETGSVSFFFSCVISCNIILPSFKAKQLHFPPSSIFLLLLSRVSVLTQSHLPNTWWLIPLFCIVLPHWFHSWDFKEISAVVALQKPFSSYLEIDGSQCYTVPMYKLGRYKRHWISLQANKALKDPKASPHLCLWAETDESLKPIFDSDCTFWITWALFLCCLPWADSRINSWLCYRSLWGCCYTTCTTHTKCRKPRYKNCGDNNWPLWLRSRTVRLLNAYISN